MCANSVLFSGLTGLYYVWYNSVNMKIGSAQEITAADAALLLGIQRRSVYAAIARGRIHVVRWMGNMLILDRQDVIRYRDECDASGVGRPPKSRAK